MLIAKSAPPQSLLAKQHNLVPMVVGTADTQQNTMPLEGAEKELLMVNDDYFTCFTTERLILYLIRTEFTIPVRRRRRLSPRRLSVSCSKIVNLKSIPSPCRIKVTHYHIIQSIHYFNRIKRYSWCLWRILMIAPPVIEEPILSIPCSCLLTSHY